MSESSKKIVVGVSGSIAAYKAAELVRVFITMGHQVRVVLTAAAQQFIGAKTFEALTGNAVTTGFWDGSETNGIGHIELADWADCVVVAPASADLIAKAVAGMANDPLLAVLLATHATVVMAPAMNVNMWNHIATQHNVSLLKGRGVVFVDPEEGMLACGWTGAGRLADPALIAARVSATWSTRIAEGRRVLVIAGPTREPIDEVRYISNRSSGRMGIALGAAAKRFGAEVQLIHGPIAHPVPTGIKSVSVTTAQEMHAAALNALDSGWDLVCMAAAVADFRPAEQFSGKIKGSRGLTSLALESNPDILSALTAARGAQRAPTIVGFCVEAGDEAGLLAEANRKLESKGADMIVANLAADAFDLATNRVWLVTRQGTERLDQGAKELVAEKIISKALSLG